VEYRIEKMNRMRRNILLGVLIGTIIAFGLVMLPSFFARFRFRQFDILFKGALFLSLLTILAFAVRYLLYRRTLQKTPSLRTAVNDERVKLNWLRAYRFALLTVVIVTLFWKWYETGFFPDTLRWKMMLPQGPWVIVFGAIISLVGSFLLYNREAS
jgi:hypothetical protein